MYIVTKKDVYGIKAGTIMQAEYDVAIDGYVVRPSELYDKVSPCTIFFKQENNVEEVQPGDIYDDVIKYFENCLDTYKPFIVVKKSNHPKDDYLYMVMACKLKTEEFDFWTCFNKKTQSMNFGHYGNWEDPEECYEEMMKYFYDAYK